MKNARQVRAELKRLRAIYENDESLSVPRLGYGTQAIFNIEMKARIEQLEWVLKEAEA